MLLTLYPMIGFLDYLPSSVLLEFNQTHNNLSVSVDLVDDNQYEGLFEEFGITLQQSSLSPNVVLESDTVIVLIEDNDGKAAILSSCM